MRGYLDKTLELKITQERNMQLVFAAALCSVLVSALMKLFKARGLNTLQMVASNYAIASILCFFWFKPDFSHVSITGTPWWIIILLAIILPSIFLCLGKALQTVGMVKTEIAQRLSVILSVIAAFMLFQEQLNLLKALGLVLGLAAILLLLFSKSGLNTTQAMPKTGLYALLAVWGGYALVDVLLKYTSSLGLQFAVTINLSFILAFIFTLVVLFVQKTQWNKQAISAGLVLGLFNFANIALYMKAHQLLKDSPAVVFVGMNILVMFLGGLLGVILFKEQLRKELFLALLLGVMSVLCLAMAV